MGQWPGRISEATPHSGRDHDSDQPERSIGSLPYNDWHTPRKAQKKARAIRTAPALTSCVCCTSCAYCSCSFPLLRRFTSAVHTYLPSFPPPIPPSHFGFFSSHTLPPTPSTSPTRNILVSLPHPCLLQYTLVAIPPCRRRPPTSSAYTPKRLVFHHYLIVLPLRFFLFYAFPTSSSSSICSALPHPTSSSAYHLANCYKICPLHCYH